ncbi:hypothetical protein [Streptomyces sp. NPDC001502]|uniref:hypothetical protein n=1 Tax=Streptomyces sp. NPDC001502 TaxID=3364578 RepID=UPI003677C817
MAAAPLVERPPAVVHTWPMLLTFIAEVADEPLVLDPGNQAAESQTNTWHLGADAEERATLVVEEVAAAFESTARALRDRIRPLGPHGTATFYVWHDEQAGQLRCSTSSQPPESLPFGGDYVLTETLEPIITGFVDDSVPGLVPWTELTSFESLGQDRAEVDPVPTPFPVWTCRIGRAI